MLSFGGSDFVVFRHFQTVTRQIIEQRAAIFDEVNVPRFFPRHRAFRQHVILHCRHQRQHAIRSPEMLIDPTLHNRQVIFVLFHQEFDDFQTQSHVA